MEKNAESKISFFPKSLNNTAYDIINIQNNYYVISNKTPLLSKKINELDKLHQAMVEPPHIEIRKCQELISGKPFLIKTYTNIQSIELKSRIENEINVTKAANHMAACFIEENKITIVNHYLPGKDLYKTLKTEKLSLEEKVIVAINIVDQYIELHKKNILHCDIKLENIIYDKETRSTGLIDFDMALCMNDNQTGTSDTFRGTFGYVAPELLIAKNNKYVFNGQTEIYALGITFAKWFDLEDHLEQESNTHNTFFSNRPLNQTELQLSKLIKMMTDSNSNNRSTLDKLKIELAYLYKELHENVKQINI
ncbi:MAG: protein kinase [Legionella longbeachae]|nr:protein kinase [Legionella longbeachae]